MRHPARGGRSAELQGIRDAPRLQKAGIRQVATLKNLQRLDLLDLLESLEPFLLEDIPEGVLGATQEELHDIDRQIGRLANTFAYISSLYAYAAGLARDAKRQGDTEAWHDAVAKKDALDKLRSAVKLKWQACSRMVTVETEVDLPDRPAYGAREERAQERRDDNKGHMKGWGNVSRTRNRTR